MRMLCSDASAGAICECANASTITAISRIAVQGQLNGSVQGCEKEDLDIGVAREAIQLIEELKHGPLHFPVSALVTVKPLGANGIDLVNEHNARRLLFGQSKGISDKLGSVSDEHLH